MSKEFEELERIITYSHLGHELSDEAGKRLVAEVERLRLELTDAESRGIAKGRIEGLREAAGIASNAAVQSERIGQTHDENSDSRCRMFARSREAASIAANILSAAAPQRIVGEGCVWSEVDDCHMPGCYDTGCGNLQYFSEGGLEDNDYKHCPYCGKAIVMGGER